MPRSVNSVAKRARRKKIMKQAKGFFGRRKNVWTVAKNAVEKAVSYTHLDVYKRQTQNLGLIKIYLSVMQNLVLYIDMSKVVNCTD